MDTEHEIRRAVGRYRASSLFLAVPTLTAALMLLSGVVEIADGHADGQRRRSYRGSCVADESGVVAAGHGHLQSGFRRIYKFTSWTEVAAVFPAGPGDPDVLIALRDGRKVSLVGVKQDRGTGILALAQQAKRQAAG